MHCPCTGLFLLYKIGLLSDELFDSFISPRVIVYAVPNEGLSMASGGLIKPSTTPNDAQGP